MPDDHPTENPDLSKADDSVDGAVTRPAPQIPASPDEPEPARAKSARRRRGAEKSAAKRRGVRARGVLAERQESSSAHASARKLALVNYQIPSELFASDRRGDLLRFLAEHFGMDILQRVVARLFERAFLLEPTGVALRALGKLAASLALNDHLDHSFANAVARSIEEVAVESAAGRDEPSQPIGEISIVGSQRAAREACRALNKLCDQERILFFQTAVLGESLASAAGAAGLEPAAARACVGQTYQKLAAALEERAVENLTLTDRAKHEDSRSRP